MEALIVIVVIIYVISRALGNSKGKKTKDTQQKTSDRLEDIMQRLMSDDDDEITAEKTAEELITCPVCHELVPSDSQFCIHCGSSMLSEDVKNEAVQNGSMVESSTRTCPVCGSSIDVGAAFCTQCGRPVPGRTEAKAEQIAFPEVPQPKAPRAPRQAPDGRQPPKVTNVAHRHPMQAEAPSMPPQKTPGVPRTKQRTTQSRQWLQPLSEEDFLKTVVWTEILGKPGGRRAR